MLSQVFYTQSCRFAFRMVGTSFRLYDEKFDAIGDFKTFERMCEYIALWDRGGEAA